MAKIQRVGSLEIDQDLDFERRQWSVQRAAWVLFLVILLAGLAGLMGEGPLSGVEASNGSLTVQYDRFVRAHALTQIDVKLSPAATSAGQVTLWLSQDYLEKFELQGVMPEPAEMALANDKVLLRFVTDSPAQPVTVIASLEPTSPGAAPGAIGVVDGPEIDINQFVYP